MDERQSNRLEVRLLKNPFVTCACEMPLTSAVMATMHSSWEIVKGSNINPFDLA